MHLPDVVATNCPLPTHPSVIARSRPICFPANHISSRFGARLRDLRKAQNLTQLRMAVDFGIDRTFISDLECGHKSICLPMLEILALGLKVSLSDLLEGL